MIGVAGVFFTIGGAALSFARSASYDLFVEGGMHFDIVDGAVNFDGLIQKMNYINQAGNLFIWTLIIGGIFLALGSVMRSNQLWKLQSSNQTDVHQLSFRIQKLEEQIKKLNNEKS